MLLFFAREAFPETARSPFTMDAVVVTAEKSDFRTGDVDTEQTPAFFSVIKREQFEGKMEDLSQVIEKESGIQIRQSGGLGSFSTVSLRGSSGEQVIVCIDGIPLNDAAGGGVNLGNISLSDVESVEIYRGTIPVHFGKSSVGGLVNIKTLRTKDGFRASAGAGYGSFNTQSFNAFLSHKPGQWDYLISADDLSSDNDFDMLNDKGTEWNTADDRWEKRHNAGFDQTNILGKLGCDFTDSVRADFQYQRFSKDQHLPNWINRPQADTALETARQIAGLKLTANNITSYHLDTAARLSYSRVKEIYDDRNGYLGLSGNEYNEYVTERYDAGFFLERLTASNAFNFTLDLWHETYDFKNLLGEDAPDEKSRRSYAAGVQNTFMLFQEKLMITPGCRYTVIRDQSDADDISRDEDYFSPQIGIKYGPLDWLTFKSNAAKYIREPSFFELFGDRGFFYGNEELKAEKGLNIDIGFEIVYQGKSSESGIQRISLNADYFSSDTDDLITRVYSHGYGKAVNISSARIRGIEAGLRLDFLKYFRLTANATWQDPENQTEKKDLKGKNLPGRFETAYAAKIEWKYSGFGIYAEYIAESNMYYDAANLLKAENKAEISAGLSWLYKSVLLTLEAKNIGDDLYEDFNGYPLPGRSYFFSIKFNY